MISIEIAKTLIGFFNSVEPIKTSYMASKVGISTRSVSRARNEYFLTGNIRPTLYSDKVTSKPVSSFD